MTLNSERKFTFINNFGSVPEQVTVAHWSSVKAVAIVILIDLYCLSIRQVELGVRNTTSNATTSCTVVRVFGKVEKFVLNTLWLRIFGVIKFENFSV